MPLGSRDRVYTGIHVKVDFQMDIAGIRRIALGESLRRSCLQVVTAAMPYAISISPRSNRTDDEHDHPHYQDSFHVETVRTGEGGDESIGHPPMLRVGARLVNVARHAAVVEFGKKGQRGQHILRKTLEHLSVGPS